MSTTPAPLALATNLLTGFEWNAARVRELLQLTAEIKARPSHYSGALGGRFIALILEKPSLRTRVTFQVGIQSMGGAAVLLDHAESRLGERESIPDVARNLSRWVQGIVARVYQQSELEQMAEYANIPVINALSDRFHPCQAYADFFTLEKHFGGLAGLTVAYVGDGNNVCHSLMVTAAAVGAHLRVGTPVGYEADATIMAQASRIARKNGGTIEIFHTAEEAVAGSQAVYTDVWASMGQEEETELRGKIFAPYQVNERLMAQAAPGAVFLHCLPAHRGAEVTDGVMDFPNSLVFDQAENRLHVQKAILLMLLS